MPYRKRIKYSSIEDALKTLAKTYDPNKGIAPSNRKHIRRAHAEVKDNEGNTKHHDCFYVTDGTIKFRHEGNDLLVPETFFLRCLQSSKYAGKVLVLFSASGSGKTVDLAGSGVTRGCHLAIVVSMEDSQAIVEAEGKKNRNKIGRKLLETKIEEVVKKSKGIVTLVNLAKPERPLKINIGIDEASSCPTLVRSIISSINEASKAVVKALLANKNVLAKLSKDAVKVSFSVAGTGASTSAGGSNTDNFEVVSPAAEEFQKRLFDSFVGDQTCLKFPGEAEKALVKYDVIEKKLPIVETLVRNGRMSSIAARQLKTRATSETTKDEELVEAELVNEIVVGYSKSNGMEPLVENVPRRHKVAACALAVHLFQWKENNPSTHKFNDDEEFQKFLSEMHCGVEFSEDVEKEVSDSNVKSAMQIIVSRFGLLEPTEEFASKKRDSRLFDLFVMKPSQQMVPLAMLGSDLGKIMDPTPFGFEYLSTHVVKCAIASTFMIKLESRPSLSCVLTKIGFQMDKNATSDAAKAKFEALEKYKVHQYMLPEKYRDDSGFSQTKQMGVELDTVYDDNGKSYLQIYKSAYSELKAMGQDGDTEAFLPKAWINYGTSPLADGFVTFFARDTSGNVSKFTIMVQTKDHHNDSRLHIRKLNEHALRCDETDLDGVFGCKQDRLLCVAGSENIVVAKTKCSHKRHFIPYASNRDKILEDLLAVLEKKKNPRRRITDHAIFCDPEGDEKI